MIDREAPSETRAQLRVATAAIHAELHCEPSFAALQRGELDRHAYQALLRQLYGFHAPLDRVLRRAEQRQVALSEALDLPARRKLPLLAADLSSLGPHDLSDIALRPMLAEPATPAELIGCLYVTEGSTLGGRMLARGLDGMLGRGVADGRRYLLGYGDRHGAMWSGFCRILETVGQDPGRRREIIASAIATFAEFRDWLRRPEAAPGGMPSVGGS